MARKKNVTWDEVKSQSVLTEREWVKNGLKYGEYGDWVEMDNGRKAIKIDPEYNTVPCCRLYENGKFIREEDSFSRTIAFLYNECN